MAQLNVLITGAAGTIGRCIARVFATKKFNLLLVDKNEKSLDELQNQIRKTWNCGCQSFNCDLESEGDREHLIDMVTHLPGGLYCLINNAAFLGHSALEGWNCSFAMQSVKTWRRALEVNLTAPFHLAKGFSKILTETSGSNIINISSIYSQRGPDWNLYDGQNFSNPAAYGVSKAGLEQLTRYLATTLAPNVRVNSISLGGVLLHQPESFIKKYISGTPMKRMAVSSDIMGTIKLLAFAQGSYITGQNIIIDGGRSVI